MAEYEQCPKFKKGSKECCGMQHDKQRKEIAGRKVTISFQAGGTVTISPHALSEAKLAVLPYGHNLGWVTEITDSPESSKISQQEEQRHLTVESRNTLFNLGFATIISTELNRNCPFNK